MLKIYSIQAPKSTLPFVALNLIDIELTWLLLSHGGNELNPVYSSLGSIQLLPITKVILTCLVLLGLGAFHQFHLLKWLNLGMGLVVAWNLVMVISMFL